MPNRLLRRRWGKTNEVMPLSEARQIVEAYGRALENTLEPPGIYDAATLPYPKKDIKRALRVVLNTPAHKILRPILRRSYMCLAQWQQGMSASHPDGTAAEPWACGMDHWARKVAAERAILKRDLDKL